MSGGNQTTVIHPRALRLSSAGRVYVVPPDFDGLFAIGRSSGCQLTLESTMVSRLHGCIRVAGGVFRYRDTSSNGTVVVNGHDETLLQEAEIELPESGMLKMGDAVVTFTCQRE